MIRFLWIKEFGSLKNQSFNFYGPRRYFYREASLQDAYNDIRELDKYILFRENTQYVKRFFCGDDPEAAEIGCTLIIGENRSGKTTLLRFLSRMLADDVEECGEFHLVWGAPDETEISFHYQAGAKGRLPKDVIKASSIYSLYYSGVFNSLSSADAESGAFPGDYNDFTNLSTDALLTSAATIPVEQNTVIKFSDGNILDRFHDSEIEKQVSYFVTSDGVDLVCRHFGIDIPDYVNIDIQSSYIGAKKRKSGTRADWEDLFCEFLDELEQGWNLGTAVNLNEKSVFLYQTVAHFVYLTLRNSSFPMADQIRSEFITNLFKMKRGSSEISGVIKADLDRICVIIHEIGKRLCLPSLSDEAVSTLNTSYLLIEKLFDSGEIRKAHTSLWKVPIASFSTVLRELKPLVRLGHWMKFDWRNMSSGEKMILAMFARLDTALQKYLSQSSTNGLFVLLDEPEVGLHPRWQQKLFAGILKYLGSIRINGSPKYIQLVFSSNQPIMASDLPKMNVCLLKYDDANRASRVLSDSEVYGLEIEAFCGNIGGILSSSFFLDRGYVGEFAEKRVNRLIDKVRANETLSEDEEREVMMIDSSIIKSYINSFIPSSLKSGNL